MASTAKAQLDLPQEEIQEENAGQIPSQEEQIILEQLQSNHFLLEDNMADLSNTIFQFDLVSKDDLTVLTSPQQNKILSTSSRSIPLSLFDEKSQRELQEALQQSEKDNVQEMAPFLAPPVDVPQQMDPLLHTCDICHKSFKKKGVLQRHKNIHFPGRPFKCEECEKCFVDKEAFDVHMKVHAGQRPYKCDYCSNSFCNRAHLKTHLRRIHGIICADMQGNCEGFL